MKITIENYNKYIIIVAIYTVGHIKFTEKYGNNFWKIALIYSSYNNI